ncbi:SDR family NAD(P)-dependent oxidoreductase [Croceicoccus sp. YJ47]|uniref:SDR family NAD(P)-dependent oxidoreductase n=1 Tax=Croceicoccus sp. YJ47 TaxID=2798724 RepID=UPI001923260F|nr:SDR family oxidoreductase [Croceicoccus sp. YJ47]QQN75305.1 SDR family oxidoreductase [Croceicoccus sp. YJ47]
MTGAARGIGKAIATRLASEGAALTISDVNADGLDRLCGELEHAGAPRCVSIARDLSKEEGATALRDTAMAAHGQVDILVNNAGGGVIRPFLEHTPETLRQTIDRNLWTTIWCTRAFLPGMIERRYGRIVNMGADSVHTGTYSHAGYNAAKGGVHAMVTGLAFEFAKEGVTFNVVSPGGVLTEDLQAMMTDDPEVLAKYKMSVHPREVAKAQIPSQRFTEMDEVAAYVAFLATEEAGAVNGQIHSINGAQWML